MDVSYSSFPLFLSDIVRKVKEYMFPDVTHIITSSPKWTEGFRDAVETNEDVVILKPEWITDSHKKQKLVDTNRYTIPRP